ncbi:MAG: glycosyltransferase family 4 protein [bacterium]
MNILLISPDFNYSCGVSKHVYLLLKELSKRENLSLYFITNQGDSLERLSGLNVKISFLDFRRGNKNPFRFVKNLFLLRSFCIHNKINVIHTHHRYPELLAYCISRILDIKTITSVHSFVNGMKLFSFKSEKIIAVSKSVQNYLINEFKVRKGKVHQIYYFVLVAESPEIEEITNLKGKLGIKPTDIVLFFAGRIGKIKGADILAHAFRVLSLRKLNIKLLLIGSYESKEFEQLFHNSKNVIYLPSTNYVHQYFYLCDIVILPSRIDPFPYVMLEAGCASKPIIGGRTGGIEEFIEDGTNGLLVEPGNVEDLIEKIEYCINEPDKSKLMGQKLFQSVSELTNADQYINRLLQIYQ